MAIQFSSHRTRFKLPYPKKTSAWIEKVVKAENARIGSLSYVFCTDKYLLGINQQYLNHDTLTDIITFDYTEKGSKALDGEIFISVQRVRENAHKLGIDFSLELHRVIVHGVLHLVGYKDKSVVEEKEMRRREDKYLKVL
ncbi:MAG TPA: rRNA maturation RNase YbeY [Cyclobacteriaceae bacterium]